MQKELDLVKQFHEKFGVPVLNTASLISQDRSTLRYKLMKEEVDEYLKAVEARDLENIAKELADILYSVYGTILEHGLHDKMEEIFEEVHRSNMSKDYHQYKMVKGVAFSEADLKKYFEEKSSRTDSN